MATSKSESGRAEPSSATSVAKPVVATLQPDMGLLVDHIGFECHHGVVERVLEASASPGANEDPIIAQVEVDGKQPGKRPGSERDPAEGALREEAEALRSREDLEPVAVEFQGVSLPENSADAGRYATVACRRTVPAGPVALHDEDDRRRSR